MTASAKTSIAKSFASSNTRFSLIRDLLRVHENGDGLQESLIGQYMKRLKSKTATRLFHKIKYCSVMKPLAVLLLILPVHVLACSCIGFNDEKAYTSHYNVFIGKLKEIAIHNSQYATGYLDPIFVAKGKVDSRSPLKAGGSMCSHMEMLKLNALYLVYGKEGEAATISQCTATRKVKTEDLDAVVEILLKLKLDAKIVEE